MPTVFVWMIFHLNGFCLSQRKPQHTLGAFSCINCWLRVQRVCSSGMLENHFETQPIVLAKWNNISPTLISLIIWRIPFPKRYLFEGPVRPELFASSQVCLKIIAGTLFLSSSTFSVKFGRDMAACMGHVYILSNEKKGPERLFVVYIKGMTFPTQWWGPKAV